MKQLLAEDAFEYFKKLQFTKSWQNVFVSKGKKLLNPETKAFEEREIDGNFIFVPAAILVRSFGTYKDFLSFRTEYKNSKDWNYNLISDPVENNNRRLAVMYADNILKSLGINFLIDDSYTVYIMEGELQKLIAQDIPGAREFVNGLYIPKTLTQKKGSAETWGN